MALVKCPECGKEISDTAKVCPHCGYKIKKEIKFNKTKIVVFGLVLLVISGILLGINYMNNNIPTKLSITLEMSQEEVHKKIGSDFVLEKDKYERDIEIYDLKWCGYDGKLAITYSTDGDKILNWKWEIDVSDMNSQDIENAMVKIRNKISNVYGKPEESDVSVLTYKWVTTHIEKTNVIFDVGYELIRDEGLWLYYGEVY